MSKQTVIYTGRHGAVDVPVPSGGEQTVRWGDEFTTTAEHAAQLLEQADEWQPAQAKKAAGKPAGAAKAAEEEA